jgi:molybdate transport system substrate-binding protein
MLAVLWILTAWDAQGQDSEIVVSAAISLKESFTEIGALYQSRTGTRVTFSFASSGELEKQIEAGAPVDVFASAGQKEMDQLEAKNLIEVGTRANFAANALVLVVPSDSTLHLRSFSELKNVNVKRIALGNPKTVPAGAYARDLLESTSLWTQLASRFVFAENVRQVLDYVSRGEVDAGIVYATDVQVAGGKVVVAAKAPEKAARAILYPVAVVKESGHSDAAKRFLALVLSPEGTQILKKYGFLAMR